MSFAHSVLLEAQVELVAQLLGIDRLTDGDDLCARRPIAPLIRLGDLRATSDNLKGDPLDPAPFSTPIPYQLAVTVSFTPRASINLRTVS